MNQYLEQLIGNLAPAALFMYDSCYIKLCSATKLVQVEKRKEKQSQNVVSPDESSFNSSTTITKASNLNQLNVLEVLVLFTIDKMYLVFQGTRQKAPKRPNYT